MQYFLASFPLAIYFFNKYTNRNVMKSRNFLAKSVFQLFYGITMQQYDICNKIIEISAIINLANLYYFSGENRTLFDHIYFASFSLVIFFW